MTDVHDKKTRSYNMSRIRSKDTKPEILVRKYLHNNGFRFNLHGKYKNTLLPGKPDIILPKYRTVIFIHGCFWHVHEGCKYFKVPETRTEWWREKLYGNKFRDEENKKQIQKLGWNIITVFECELKQEKKIKTLLKMLNKIKGGANG